MANEGEWELLKDLTRPLWLQITIINIFTIDAFLIHCLLYTLWKSITNHNQSRKYELHAYIHNHIIAVQMEN